MQYLQQLSVFIRIRKNKASFSFLPIDFGVTFTIICKMLVFLLLLCAFAITANQGMILLCKLALFYEFELKNFGFMF